MDKNIIWNLNCSPKPVKSVCKSGPILALNRIGTLFRSNSEPNRDIIRLNVIELDSLRTGFINCSQDNERAEHVR